MKHIFHDFAVVPLSKLCFPPKAGSIFLKSDGYFVKKSRLKHYRHKENIISHTNFAKLKVRCIQSFLMTGLCGRKMHCTAARSNILKRASSEKCRSERPEERKEQVG